jgi:parallel beta-helix repeat protein
MRLSVVGVLSLLWIVGSSSINSNQASLQVTCSEPQGCFGLLGKALAAAPTGSTISIGPGIFYERPLVIDKSFVLQGAGADLTKIRIVEPGSAITIRSAELVEVMIASLAIAVPFVWDERRIGTGVVWVQQSDKTQTIVMKDAEIISFSGVVINGRKGSFTIQRSRFQNISSGVAIRTRGEITVAVEDTSLSGPFLYADPLGLSRLVISSAISFITDDSPARAFISLKNNTLDFWHMGLHAVSAGDEGWSKAEFLLIGNTIDYNTVGVFLAGDTDAELRANIISNNDNGMVLFLPPCSPISSYDVIAFRGKIQGRDNVITDNKKADLCPDDYPWPPGFRKP